MEFGTGTLVFLAAVVLILIAVCIRWPRLGLCITILMFIPAPLWPEEDNVMLFYGFGAFTMLVLIGWLLKAGCRVPPFRDYAHSEKIESCLKLWMLLCALGLPLSLLFNKGGLDDRLLFYIKGLVPFLYLLVFFVVRSLPLKSKQIQNLLSCVLAVAIAFTVITLVIYAITGGRVTWVYATLTFPFPVLGANVTFSRMLLARSRFAVFAWALLTGILSVAAMLTFSKGEMIALIVSLPFNAFLINRYGMRRTGSRMVAFVAVIGICALAFAAYASSQTTGDMSFSELAAARLNDESSAGTRLSEYEAALQAFAESPLIGKGVGYQLERDSEGHMVTAEYVHDQIVYTAMTTGVVGLCVYLMLIYNWAKLVRRFRPMVADVVGPLATIHGCVLALGVYALMFASFRSIPHNFLLGTFLALALQLSSRLPRATTPAIQPVRAV